MMVTVQGGTKAGWRVVLPESKNQWRCDRGHMNPRYASKCFTVGCSCERPK